MPQRLTMQYIHKDAASAPNWTTFSRSFIIHTTVNLVAYRSSHYAIKKISDFHLLCIQPISFSKHIFATQKKKNPLFTYFHRQTMPYWTFLCHFNHLYNSFHSSSIHPASNSGFQTMVPQSNRKWQWRTSEKYTNPVTHTQTLASVLISHSPQSPCLTSLCYRVWTSQKSYVK